MLFSCASVFCQPHLQSPSQRTQKGNRKNKVFLPLQQSEKSSWSLDREKYLNLETSRKFLENISKYSRTMEIKKLSEGLNLLARFTVNINFIKISKPLLDFEFRKVLELFTTLTYRRQNIFFYIFMFLKQPYNVCVIPEKIFCS